MVRLLVVFTFALAAFACKPAPPPSTSAQATKPADFDHQLGDARRIAAAIEGYAVDAGYPTANSIQELESLVVPKYAKEIPFGTNEGNYGIACSASGYTITAPNGFVLIDFKK